MIFIVATQLYNCTLPQDKDNVSPATGSRNDSWSITGPGGGGAMFYPAVSPHDADYAFVSCDMTGAYVTYNGGDSWRMFNLRSPVRWYVFDPLDENVIYANSIALYRSMDRGKTWNVLYPDPSRITRIISRGDHASEIVVTRDSIRENVNALAIDPEDSKKLYAAISAGRTNALFVSDDFGATWTKEKELGEVVKNIFIVPSSDKNNRTLYLTGKNSITYRENGTWKTNEGPAGVDVLTQYGGGFDKNRNKFIIYAISGKSYFNSADENSGIHYTEDGGKTWENRQEGLLQYHMKDAPLPEWRSIGTSAGNPEVVYISYNGLKMNEDTTCIGVAKSTDYGKTWVLAWTDVLTASGDQTSANFEEGWLEKHFGPTWGENPFSIGVSPVNPGVVYCTDFGRTIKTSDGGESWEQVYTNEKQDTGWITRGLDVTTGYCIVFDPFDINHVYLALTDVGLMESNDGGESWIPVSRGNGIPRRWSNSTYWLAFDPEVKGKVWAVMSANHDLPRPKMFRRNGTAGFRGGILMKTGGMENWQQVSDEIGESAFTHILIDPASSKESRTLYACAFGKGVYKSVDGGKSWELKNNGIPGDEPFAWRITYRESDGTLFLVVCRRSEDGSISDDGDGALYRSVDGAETWTKVPLPDGTNGPMSLVVDPDNPSRLVMSAWGRVSANPFSPDTGGGIYVSADEGITWKQVLEKDQHIHDITYDSRNKAFYASGFGS